MSQKGMFAQHCFGHKHQERLTISAPMFSIPHKMAVARPTAGIIAQLRDNSWNGKVKQSIIK